MKTSWKLDAQLLEQLSGRDVRKPFEAAAHQWPDHRQRVVYRLTGFGIDQPRPLRHLLSRNSRWSLRKRLCNSRKQRGVLRRLCATWLNHGLQTAQIARFGLYGKCWTDLARSPRAGKTGNETGEIRWFGYCAWKVAPISECHQMRLNRAYLLQELQRVQRADHLPQLGFRGIREAFGLLQPFTRVCGGWYRLDT